MHGALALYGVLMIAIGVVGYLVGGMAHWTALIPAILGVVAVVVAKGPMLRSAPVGVAMIGVVLAALALFGSAGALLELSAAFAPDPTVNAPAVLARSATAVLSIGLLLAVAALWFRRRKPA